MKFILVLSSAILLISCQRPAYPSNEITKVELARSGAWSDYGATISIDSSLNYKYYGDYGKMKQGYFVGKVNGRFWDSLIYKLEKIKYKTLRVADNANTVDVNYFELIVHWKNNEKRISRVEKYPADSVFKVIKWIDTSYLKLSLRQIKDSIKFESAFHNLPKPQIKRVNFPPPIIKSKNVPINNQ